MDPNKLDLTCQDNKKIGVIGSIYFTGFAISCAIIPRIADKIGRRHLHNASMMSQVLIYGFIINSKDINNMLFLYFCIGLTCGGRCGVGINYISEFIPHIN